MSDAHLFEADVRGPQRFGCWPGELVAFPTETVYGLGADATNAAAVDRIFTLKGRPRGHPVIVHVPRGADLEAFFARDLPLVAHRLMEQFWPGPLTLILNRQEGHASTAAGGQPTIGLRCPDHAVAQQLLQQLARMHQHVGLAAPSANPLRPCQSHHGSTRARRIRAAARHPRMAGRAALVSSRRFSICRATTA